MKPSEIRQTILDEHGHLRRKIATIEAHLMPSLARLPRWREDLAREIEELSIAFHAHLETEERLLPTVLTDVDPSGPMRLAAMAREHAAQRAALSSIMRHPVADPQYDASLRQFLRVLVRDIDDEERDLLGPDVLRDDSINIDAFGG
ncbi:MAG: hemerythrin domain-containing protein [Planctomycetes bacterium]|nr:hemerythrin domain-containing protein [Planctomycetota bacterium]